MKIMFVSWGEVPRMSSVYGGQLVNVAMAVGQSDQVTDVSLVAGMPIIHSGMVREKWHYGKQIALIENALGRGNFLRRRLVVPPVGIYPTQAQLPLFKLGQMASMIALLRQKSPDILHCRSYLATYMAHEWRKASGLEYKILFDTRSYMPDEALLRGRWTEGSADHKFWKKTELQLLLDSDAINVVSEPMRTRFVEMGADRDKIHLIHLNVKEPEGIADPDTNLGSSPRNAKPVFCYCGYLDYNGWHHPSNLWQLFDEIAKRCDDAQFLVITKSSHSALKKDLFEKGFGQLDKNIRFTSAESSSECVRIMQNCDVGLLSYFTPKTALELDMAKGVFATKTAEYLFAGLPVLVNSVCGGAADFVTEHDAGVVYTEGQPLTDAEIEHLMYLRLKNEKLKLIANNSFNIDVNAKRLINIYSSIMGKLGA